MLMEAIVGEQEKIIPEGQNDLERLVYVMKALSQSDFRETDTASYDNMLTGDIYNSTLKSIMDRNNHFLLRINDAMIRIANGSILKELLEQVESQRGPIKSLKETRNEFGLSLDRIGSNGIEILAMSRQARNSIEPGKRLAAAALDDTSGMKAAFNEICLKAEKIDNLLKAADNGISDNKEITECLEQIKSLCGGALKNAGNAEKNIQRTAECIDNIINQIKIISDDMKDIYSEIGDQTLRAEIFLKNVDSISGSYDALYMQCFNLGRHLYRISRDIDNARNDMYRQNSKPTMHDALKIFDVDHLTLTWRLYNTIIEYETLKITQLNNPDRCKFGLWWRSQTDPVITGSKEYQLVYDTHDELHKHAVSCFLAKESSNIQEAMDEFILALDAYDKFHAALDQMHAYLRKNGITEETEVWVYKG